jgi:hypothetical protein
MKTIFFVTSLPRSGTTSLCEMSKICGIKSQHILGNHSFQKLIDNEILFFADTPFFSPEFLVGFLENNTNYNVKFIYSLRETESHTESLKYLYKIWSPFSEKHCKHNLLDRICHEKIIKTDILKNHKKYIKLISETYDVPMLEYSFSNGWTNFCSFIDKPIPNQPIPHKNKKQ